MVIMMERERIARFYLKLILQRELSRYMLNVCLFDYISGDGVCTFAGHEAQWHIHEAAVKYV